MFIEWLINFEILFLTNKIFLKTLYFPSQFILLFEKTTKLKKFNISLKNNIHIVSVESANFQLPK